MGDEGKSRVAFVLDRAATRAPQVFGGVPGRWVVGEPLVPEALGMTATEFQDLVRERELPFSRTTVTEAEHERQVAAAAKPTVPQLLAESDA